jgi:hypothetical protein
MDQTKPLYSTIPRKLGLNRRFSTKYALLSLPHSIPGIDNHIVKCYKLHERTKPF